MNISKFVDDVRKVFPSAVVHVIGGIGPYLDSTTLSVVIKHNDLNFSRSLMGPSLSAREYPQSVWDDLAAQAVSKLAIDIMKA